MRQYIIMYAGSMCTIGHCELTTDSGSMQQRHRCSFADRTTHSAAVKSALRVAQCSAHGAESQRPPENARDSTHDLFTLVVLRVYLSKVLRHAERISIAGAA